MQRIGRSSKIRGSNPNKRWQQQNLGVRGDHCRDVKKWTDNREIRPYESASIEESRMTPSVEKREPSYILGRNVSWYSHYGKQYGGSSEN